jgi:uncharacterized membrane protein
MIELLKSPIDGKLALLTTILVGADLAILLDIPVFRQVLGFVFITFIPGYLIICLMRLDKLGLPERFILSVGLSLFFSMFFGLLINWSYFYFGYITPLSTISVVISFSCIFIILLIFVHRINKEALSFRLSGLRLNTAEKALLLLPLAFPFLSIYGMHVLNTTGSNNLLLVLLFLIPAYIILVAAASHKIPERIFPIMVFLIGISIILMVPLRSNHIIGLDAHSEYDLFQMTNVSHYWKIFIKNNLSSCLSISMLPSLYQSVMNINPERLFSILFSLIFSISTLQIYIISKKYIGAMYAFFAAFFFASIPDFALTSLLARSNMAILYFGMAAMVVFHIDINNSTKKLLFIIFLSCVVVSHYSTTYILFFVLLTTLVVKAIFARIFSCRRSFSAEKGNPFDPIFKKVADLVECKKEISDAIGFEFFRFINISIVLLFFVVLFLWYGQVTDIPFRSGINFLENSLISLQELFVLESRSPTVMTAFGQNENFHSLFVTKVIFVIWWATIALTATGILITLIRFKDMLTTFQGFNLSVSLSKKIDTEFFLMSLSFCLMMVVSLVVPAVSTLYSMNRQYLMSMVLLSPFLVLGAITIERYLQFKPRWLLTVVLVLYFLSTSGVLYQVAGTPSAITLNSEGKAYNMYYINDSESSAAKWLGSHREDSITIYGDVVVPQWLLSQAGISGGVDKSLLLLDKDKKTEGYIYLRSHNIFDGKLMNTTFDDLDVNEYKDKFAKKAKCYSNEAAEIWI